MSNNNETQKCGCTWSADGSHRLTTCLPCYGKASKLITSLMPRGRRA